MPVSHSIPTNANSHQLDATLLSNWVELLYRCIAYRGLDANELFSQAGVDESMRSADQRIQASKVKHLWELAAQRTGDDAFGLTAAEVAYPVMFDSLSVAMSSSATLLEALQRFIRLRRIIDSQCVNTLEEVDGGYKFGWSNADGCESQIGAEAFVAAMITLCRWGSGPAFSPEWVSLCHEETESAQRYRRFFNAPVEFQANENALLLSEEALLRPLMTANKELALSSEKLSRDHLAQIEKTGVVSLVHNKLVEFLPQRTFTEDILAEELGMSLRSMQRRLLEEGTSYESLLQSVRKEAALQLLQKEALSIADIAQQLGFSSASNFGRAFKRWTGRSPASFR